MQASPEQGVIVEGSRASPRDRVLGRVRGSRPGPTLICVGGVHGNEPAGVSALERVLPVLSTRSKVMCGEFVALLGNRSAFAEGRRFIDRDLNRAWTEQRLDWMRNGGTPDDTVEDREQAELLEVMDDVLTDARGPVYVIDFHTTSGLGGTFSTFGDTLPNRNFARHIPLPMVLGLEELIEGTMLSFLGEHGLVAIAVETGQHEEAAAVDRAEAAIWIAIRTVGLLTSRDVPEAALGHERLRKETQRLPRAVEMRHRYDIEPEHGFRMNPGYENFDTVSTGEAIARDRDGDVVVEEDAILLMPLYQEQGEDGFFLVREFSPLWLRVSHALRTLKLDRVAHLLPGVSADPADANVLHVDKRVARLFALQLFHLLGYRSVEESGDRLVVRRRSFDERRFVARGPTPKKLR